jgi:hypothetical protein
VGVDAQGDIWLGVSEPPGDRDDATPASISGEA